MTKRTEPDVAVAGSVVAANAGPLASSGQVPRDIASPRTLADRLFRGSAFSAGLLVFAILGLIGLFLAIQAAPAFRHMGLAFLTTPGWVPQAHGGHPASFGIGVAGVGTVVIAVIALVVAVPFSIGAALFITEYAPRSLFGVVPLRSLLTSVIDLMAAVPSIIYGLWGLLVLEPHMVGVSRWIADHLGFIPFLGVSAGTTTYTGSFFILGVLVGIMLLPIVTSLSRELFNLTPVPEREGALALGASRARVFRDVVLPFARSGLIGSIMLGLGRALGEAIAVSLVISLSFVHNWHIVSPGANSVPALIANLFGSGGSLGRAGLLAAGLVLFLFTLLVNTLASVIVGRTRRRIR